MSSLEAHLRPIFDFFTGFRCSICLMPWIYALGCRVMRISRLYLLLSNIENYALLVPKTAVCLLWYTTLLVVETNIFDDVFCLTPMFKCCLRWSIIFWLRIFEMLCFSFYFSIIMVTRPSLARAKGDKGGLGVTGIYVHLWINQSSNLFWIFYSNNYFSR